MRRLVLLVALLISAPVFAGYYARVTGYVPDMQYTRFPTATVSGCYLTPSMAIASLGGAPEYFAVTSLTAEGTWSVRGTTSGVGSASGTFSQCDASPSVYGLPTMDGGVTDPAITGGSVISGGGSGSGANPEEVEALKTQVIELQGQVVRLTNQSLTSSEHQQVTDLIVQAESPYDYANGGKIFTAMLISTLSLYIMVRAMMEIYGAVKQARRL